VFSLFIVVHFLNCESQELSNRKVTDFLYKIEFDNFSSSIRSKAWNWIFGHHIPLLLIHVLLISGEMSRLQYQVMVFPFLFTLLLY